MDDWIAYLGLFATAFGAATFLPIPSEPLLLAMAAHEEYAIGLLWGIATLGNLLGALFNWWLGTQLPRFAGRKWFPISAKSITKTKPIYQKYGKWSLLLAWLPVIGDPLTLIAGIFRLPLRWFIPLVALGKGGRYAALLSFI